MVPADVISELVVDQQPEGVRLLRAEILLSTPSSFVMPRGWRGSADRPERSASLEYILVQPDRLSDYRNVMRDYCGPAAMKLVQASRFGTFRAMETAAVLYRDRAMNIDWNQIHLCELDTTGFEGFGGEFAAALRAELPAGPGRADPFASLAHMRTVNRWTFNDPIVEKDGALGGQGGLAQ